jgi:Flp pilus assembly protein TadG
MNARRFLTDTFGTAAVEFALIVPLLVILLFVGTEAGHFVWTQHKLTDAVRDGARYASRLRIEQVCNGATSVLADPSLARVKLITRTGQLDNNAAGPVVPGWTPAQVAVTINCQSFVNTGIYTDLNAAGPIVTVRASNVPYPSLFNLLGGISGAVNLNAKASAAVIGI